jgi:hypothetical protein
MPDNNSPMQGMMPAFMNSPQHQQQMQGLAMQLRQQEDGIKRTKKFLKAYEDIQLNQPIPPQQPSFMQPPGGQVQAQNQQLAASVAPEAAEAGPTSFTQMAGGMGGQQGMEGDTGSAGTPGPTPEGPEFRSEQDKERLASRRQKIYDGLLAGEEYSPPGEEKLPLEKRGDYDASRETRQDFRKKSDMRMRDTQKQNALGKAELEGFGSLDESLASENDLRRQISNLEKDIKKGSATTIETDPSTGKTYPIPGMRGDKIPAAKEKLKKLKADVEKIMDLKKKVFEKLEKIRKSVPNKSMGLGLGIGIGGSLMADAYATDASSNTPEMRAGRAVDQGAPGRNDNPRTSAAHQAYLEQQAKSGNYMVNRKPGARGQEPIEYSAGEDVRNAQ